MLARKLTWTAHTRLGVKRLEMLDPGVIAKKDMSFPQMEQSVSVRIFSNCNGLTTFYMEEWVSVLHHVQLLNRNLS